MARARPSPSPDPLDRLLGEAPAIHALRTQIRHLARFDAVGSAAVPTVLLQGETGTGKGLVARVIHDSGPRAPGPFIAVNCAAIPETLLEAELFGVEAGAFTDAKHAKPGLFEAASGGTLFLDEIDALPLALQGKCLTAIEDKRVRRVGAVAERLVDVKLIAATQVALNGQVQAGRFRADLYHRLAVVVLELPPLRERGDDIGVLARALLQQYGAAYGVGPQRLSHAAEAWLFRQPWPGNVRELGHLLERVALLETAMLIDPESLERLCISPPLAEASAVVRGTSNPGEPQPETERLAEALRRSGGNLAAAARLLGMSRGGLRHRLHKYQMRPPPRPSSRTGQDPGEGEPAPPSSTSHPMSSSDRREEASLLSSPLGGAGQDKKVSTRRDEKLVNPERGSSSAPVAGWVPKPVAVLAIAATWPEPSEPAAVPYEPWTVASRWEQRVAEKVAGFGGVILQGSTSLLLAAFGLPQTLEQLPQRAIQAALAIRRAADEANGPVVRLAGHLGTLLVVEEAGEPPWRWLAVGETLALPVRLLGQAAPGEVLVSDPLGQLTAGWAEGQPRMLSPGSAPSAPFLAHRVLGLLPRHDTLTGIGRRARAPLLGRTRELAMLQSVLTQVEGGRGQVVGMMGEPGMGKSRLLAEWRQALAQQDITCLEGHCWSYGTAMPYLPVLDLLRAHCGIMPTDSADIIAKKVCGGLEAVGLTSEEGAPYLLHLLGIEAGGERLVEVSPAILKAKTFETLRQLCLRHSREQLLVIAVEDLHWIDPTSEAFFASLVERLPGARLLFLGTYRSGYRPLWSDKSYATQLTLPALSAQDSLQVVHTVLQTENLPEPLAQDILAKAQGNPFFLEEIAQTLVDQGVLRRDPPAGTAPHEGPRMGYHGASALPTVIHLPPTVQGVLAARIDRLPDDERALLQTLAVIGHVCSLRLLMQVVAQPEAEVSQRLYSLQGTELLYEQPAALEPTYAFKHVLTQEVAYHSLSQERRCALHERTAQAIEELFGGWLAERYGELAHHYSRSGNTQKAVVYLQRAGQQAADRSAYREAMMHLTRKLELLPGIPDALERTRHELDLQITLGHALMVIQGQGAPEAEHAYTRARELCEQLGETPQLFLVLGGLRVVYEVRGAWQQARKLAEQMLGLARRAQDSGRLVRAHGVLGSTLFFLGEFASARAHLEQGIAQSSAIQDLSAALRDADQIHASRCRRYLAWTLWYLGYADQALQESHEAVVLAEQLAHPYSEAYALYSAARLHGLRRGVWAAQERAEAVIALAQRHEFPGMMARGTMLRGWALAAQGREPEGIAQIRQGMDALSTMGVDGQRPYGLAMLAEAYGRTRQTEEALRLLDEAQALTRQGGHFYAAEVHRLTGELLLMQDEGGSASGSPSPDLSMIDGHAGEATVQLPRQTEAETCFRQALDIARRQQAKALELRAATSLSRLWQQQGRRDAARELLAPIYGWFTEGFDTADLREAKALLGDLS